MSNSKVGKCCCIYSSIQEESLSKELAYEIKNKLEKERFDQEKQDLELCSQKISEVIRKWILQIQKISLSLSLKHLRIEKQQKHFFVLLPFWGEPPLPYLIRKDHVLNLNERKDKKKNKQWR